MVRPFHVALLKRCNAISIVYDVHSRNARPCVSMENVNSFSPIERINVNSFSCIERINVNSFNGSMKIAVPLA